MDKAMELKLAQFEQNRKAIKKSGFLIDYRIAAACACLFSLDGRQVTVDELKEARAILKSKVSIFSSFRGYTQTAIACTLAGRPDAEAVMDQSLEAYRSLKKNFFFTDFLPMAAMITAQSVPSARYDEVSDRTAQLFKLIKKAHPLLTGQEDELMCVLLALQDAPLDSQAENCEFCFKHLKGQFGVLASNDGIQSLSHVIAAAGGDLEANCSRAVELFKYFKEHGSPMTNGYGLGALGALAILPVPVEELGERVLAVSAALKTQNGYGILGISRWTRMTHAALLTASDYASEKSGVIAAIQGTISAIIAEEIMIMCMVSAHAAASASSN